MTGGVVPIFKKLDGGKFVPFEQTPFPGLEKTLEDWLEANPHMLLEGEQLAIIARQPRTGYDKQLDLLAVDKTGALVVIELKRGETPRDVVAQSLEYAAWADSLNQKDLDGLATAYANAKQIEASGVADLYDDEFGDDADVDDSGARLSDRITFNNRQRIVIVAEQFTGEVEQTLRYLRTKYGVDVYGIKFTVHQSDQETIFTTTAIVGREQTKQSSIGPREMESHESIKDRVKTKFLLSSVDSIPDWVTGLNVEGLTVQRSGGSDHSIRHHGATLAFYYFAQNWIYMILYNTSDDENTTLQDSLSKQEELIFAQGGKGRRFHLVSGPELEIVKKLIADRIGG
jgi:hypothetical protein